MDKDSHRTDKVSLLSYTFNNLEPIRKVVYSF